MPGNRRQSREAALSFLYQRDLSVQSRTDDPEQFIEHFQLPEAFQSFFLQLVRGVLEHQKAIDLEIEAAAENWKLSRMAKIDLSILRLGCYELIYQPQTSLQIIIDEAIELAKEYGSTDSSSFVNGILDRIARKVRAKSLELIERSHAS